VNEQPIVVTVEPLTATHVQCERCRRFRPPDDICNLGICQRCVVVCLDGGWIVPVTQTTAEWADVTKRGQFQLTAQYHAAKDART
jgi:hypothetical protein